MKIIVMGCGRVGSQVSLVMAAHGHDVTVIDHDNNAENRLGADFKVSLADRVQRALRHADSLAGFPRKGISSSAPRFSTPAPALWPYRRTDG